LQGVLDVFDRISKEYDFGAAADSLWRVLLYTELARSLQTELTGLPPGAPTPEEDEFLCSLGSWDDLLAVDFTQRLEGFVRRIDAHSKASAGKRVDIREFLFGHVLPDLRQRLKIALDGRSRVTLIIDNLDKAWKPESYSQPLRELLLGLMRVSGEVIREFAGPDYRGRAVPLSVLVFLRSDIFTSFLDEASEKDKIPMKRMAWDDPDTLLRVITERFAFSAPASPDDPQDVWMRYFTPTVSGCPVKAFLTACVLPRPRDLIYLVSSAVDLAIDRGHTVIEEADLLGARHEYSRSAFFSIVDEGRTRFDRVEYLLFEFLGVAEVVTLPEIVTALDSSGIAKSQLAALVDLLCDLTFLGLEVAAGEFRFVHDYRDRAQIRALADAYARTTLDLARFQISPPFHPYLEIKLS
jgi:hypothetical protein